jgi:hypothetical protein
MREISCRAFSQPEVSRRNREWIIPSHHGEEKMRRLIPAILVLLLLIDLADDGFPGKVRFVSHVSPLSGSVASYLQYSVEQVDSHCEPPLPDSPGIFNHYQDQTVTCSFLNNLKKISFCHTSSSGGIPL